MRTISLLLLAFLSGFSLAQEPQIDVQQVSALTADSASIEPMAERVAIFATNLDKQAQYGLRVAVNSAAKFVVLRVANSQHKQINPHKMAGESSTWIVFGDPGIYYLTIIESDPETGLAFYDSEHSIVGRPAEPVPGPDPKPDPDTDFNLFVQAADRTADEVNDPPTRVKLAAAYRAVISGASGQTYDSLLLSAQKARFAVMNARTGLSRHADWNRWLIAIDDLLRAHVQPGDALRYITALEAIAQGLESGG